MAAGPSQAPSRTAMASWNCCRAGSLRAIEGASGSRASKAWGIDRPPAISAMSMSSRLALSEPPAQITERTRAAMRRRGAWRSARRRSRS
jgi:hypothetical protein